MCGGSEGVVCGGGVEGCSIVPSILGIPEYPREVCGWIGLCVCLWVWAGVGV